MKFSGIVFLGYGLLWVLIASAQSSRSVGLRLSVPRWLAKLSGSKTSDIDPGLLSLQILCALSILWSIPSSLLFGDTLSLVMFQKGLLFIVPTTFVIFLLLIFLSKKQKL